MPGLQNLYASLPPEVCVCGIKFAVCNLFTLGTLRSHWHDSVWLNFRVEFSVVFASYLYTSYRQNLLACKWKQRGGVQVDCFLGTIINPQIYLIQAFFLLLFLGRWWFHGVCDVVLFVQGFCKALRLFCASPIQDRICREQIFLMVAGQKGLLCTFCWFITVAFQKLELAVRWWLLCWANLHLIFVFCYSILL